MLCIESTLVDLALSAQRPLVCVATFAGLAFTRAIMVAVPMALLVPFCPAGPLLLLLITALVRRAPPLI